MPEMSEKMKDTLFYQKVAYANGNTLIYLQDEESLKDNICGMMAEALSKKDRHRLRQSLIQTGKSFVFK